VRNFVMRAAAIMFVAVSASLVFTAAAHADDAPTPRDIQSAVDSYLASADEAQLVGGPGSAGYGPGFWIRDGDFSLHMGLTLQARFEGYRFADSVDQPPNGDTSGFSLPRATLKLYGTAPCCMSYYAELQFGHFGRDALEQRLARADPGNFLGGPNGQSINFDVLREAWIEWTHNTCLRIRFGLIQPPTSRELLTPAELQQFVDISLGAVFLGQMMPGYTDRSRDYGVMFHGVFGSEKRWSYAVSITNGDGGDNLRNVLDQRTDENLAFAGRLNYAFWNPIGYEEGALRQLTCQKYGEVGMFLRYSAAPNENPSASEDTFGLLGLDLAMGYGPWSLTAWVMAGRVSGVEDLSLDSNLNAGKFQIGYHFPGTAWELAVRFSGYDVDSNIHGETLTTFRPFKAGRELAAVVNYYLDGHRNKLQFDVSAVVGDDGHTNEVIVGDPTAGYPGGFATGDETSLLFRFQWQLAL